MLIQIDSEGAFVWWGSGCSCSMGVANWSGFCSQRHQSAQPGCHSYMCVCVPLILWFQTEPMNAASAKQGAAWAVVGVDCYFIFACAFCFWILISFYFLATLLSLNNMEPHFFAIIHIFFISSYKFYTDISVFWKVFFILTLSHQIPALTYFKSQSINLVGPPLFF